MDNGREKRRRAMIFIDWPVRNSLYKEIANYYIYRSEIEREDDIGAGFKKYILFLKMAGMKKSMIGEIAFSRTINISTLKQYDEAVLKESAIFLWDKIPVTKVHLEHIAIMMDMRLKADVVFTSSFIEKYLFSNKFYFSSKLLYSSDKFDEPSTLSCNLLIYKNEYDIMFAHFEYFRYPGQKDDYVIYKGGKILPIEFERILSLEFNSI